MNKKNQIMKKNRIKKLKIYMKKISQSIKMKTIIFSNKKILKISLTLKKQKKKNSNLKIILINKQKLLMNKKNTLNHI